MGQRRNSFADLIDNGTTGDWCFIETKDKLTLFLRYPIPDEIWKTHYLPEVGEVNRGDIVRLPIVSGTEMTWKWNGSHEATNTLTVNLGA